MFRVLWQRLQGRRCADRMSGPSPLGYDARDKKLVVNPDEAETVHTLFRLYLELGTVK